MPEMYISGAKRKTPWRFSSRESTRQRNLCIHLAGGNGNGNVASAPAPCIRLFLIQVLLLLLRPCLGLGDGLLGEEGGEGELLGLQQLLLILLPLDTLLYALLVRMHSAFITGSA